MANSRLILFSFSLYTCLAAATLGELQNKFEFSKDRNNASKRDPRLTFIGEVGSKIFYLDLTPRSWSVSVDFCASQGMNISRIETTPEGALLASKLNSTYYWVDGIDSGKISQFISHDGAAFKTSHPITHYKKSCMTFGRFTSSSFFLYGGYHTCLSALPVICQL